MSEWITVGEAARLFGVSEAYVRSHIKKGWMDCDCHGVPIHLRGSELDVFYLPLEMPRQH
jgi:hypothetical protein